ncbi:MAG TPA: hypothetical protein VEZ40_09630 [Pyrinomonadaceae bacterium]|nr:hypothetical protein [Pyrinomonadaceae bacterium]
MMRAVNMMPVKREMSGEGRMGRRAPGRREVVMCALLVALLLGVRVWRLDASCLWFDEVFSVHAARHGWGGLLEFVALDLIHPPLFYLLLKVWMAIVGGGESVWWLRLFPLLTQAAAVVPLLLLCRELGIGGGAVRVALLLLVAVNGYLIQHAQGLRMYSLLLLFAACSLWLFARFSDAEARGRGGALALFAVNLLLVYTHYFGWLLVGLEGLFVVIRRRERLKVFVVSLVALAVCFSPWMWLVWRAAGAGEELLAQNIGWQTRPRLADIFHPFLLLHEPFRFRRNTYEPLVLRVDVWLTVALFVPPLVALCWRAVKRRRLAGAEPSEDETAREEAAATTTGDVGVRAMGDEAGTGSGLTFLLFFSLAPVVVAFVLARALPQSIWGTRHLIIVAPAYLLLASVALVSLRRPVWLSITLKLLLACWLTLAAMLWLMRRSAPPVWCAWETLARKVVEADANAAEGEVRVYAAEDLVAYHLWYGLSSTGDGRFRVAAVKNLPGLPEDRAFFLPRGFDEVAAVDASAVMREEHYFWVAFRDTYWNPEHPLLRLLAERGYEVEPRFEVAASGQKAFLVHAKRRGR